MIKPAAASVPTMDDLDAWIRQVARAEGLEVLQADFGPDLRQAAARARQWQRVLQEAPPLPAGSPPWAPAADIVP